MLWSCTLRYMQLQYIYIQKNNTVKCDQWVWVEAKLILIYIWPEEVFQPLTFSNRMKTVSISIRIMSVDVDSLSICSEVLSKCKRCYSMNRWSSPPSAALPSVWGSGRLRFTACESWSKSDVLASVLFLIICCFWNHQSYNDNKP